MIAVPGIDKYDCEGRLITVEYDKFYFLTSCKSRSLWCHDFQIGCMYFSPVTSVIVNTGVRLQVSRCSHLHGVSILHVTKCSGGAISYMHTCNT